jgi:D-3-phosphoglycerate dehydrogenase
LFEKEPPGKCPLFELDRVIGTPHLGAETREAQVNVAIALANQFVDFLKNGTIINAVNAPFGHRELLEKLRPVFIVGRPDRIFAGAADQGAHQRGRHRICRRLPGP